MCSDEEKACSCSPKKLVRDFFVLFVYFFIDAVLTRPSSSFFLFLCCCWLLLGRVLSSSSSMSMPSFSRRLVVYVDDGGIGKLLQNSAILDNTVLFLILLRAIPHLFRSCCSLGCFYLPYLFLNNNRAPTTQFAQNIALAHE